MDIIANPDLPKLILATSRRPDSSNMVAGDNARLYLCRCRWLWLMCLAVRGAKQSTESGQIRRRRDHPTRNPQVRTMYNPGGCESESGKLQPRPRTPYIRTCIQYLQQLHYELPPPLQTGTRGNYSTHRYATSATLQNRNLAASNHGEVILHPDAPRCNSSQASLRPFLSSGPVVRLGWLAADCRGAVGDVRVPRDETSQPVS